MILDLSKKEHVPLINQYKKCKGMWKGFVNDHF